MTLPPLVNPAEDKTYNPNEWLDRCRGKRREQEEERPEQFFITLHPWSKAAPSELLAHLSSIAGTFAEKPRWQKIIEHANSLADELEMSREQFYTTALIEFIEKKENERITEELNEAYKNIDQDEDLAFLNRVVSHYDPRLADE